MDHVARALLFEPLALPWALPRGTDRFEPLLLPLPGPPLAPWPPRPMALPGISGARNCTLLEALDPGSWAAAGGLSLRRGVPLRGMPLSLAIAPLSV